MSDQPKKATIEDIVQQLKWLNEQIRDMRDNEIEFCARQKRHSFWLRGYGAVIALVLILFGGAASNSSDTVSGAIVSGIVVFSGLLLLLRVLPESSPVRYDRSGLVEAINKAIRK